MKDISEKQDLIDQTILEIEQLDFGTETAMKSKIIKLLTAYTKDLEALKLSIIQRKIRQLSRLEKDLQAIFDKNDTGDDL